MKPMLISKTEEFYEHIMQYTFSQVMYDSSVEFYVRERLMVDKTISLNELIELKKAQEEFWTIYSATNRSWEIRNRDKLNACTERIMKYLWSGKHIVEWKILQVYFSNGQESHFESEVENLSESDTIIIIKKKKWKSTFSQAIENL